MQMCWSHDLEERARNFTDNVRFAKKYVICEVWKARFGRKGWYVVDPGMDHWGHSSKMLPANRLGRWESAFSGVKTDGEGVQ